MADPFLISNMQIGLERDREPWLLPDEAFPTLEDAYLFRGRIKRRLGFDNLDRLCQQGTAIDDGARVPPDDQRTGTIGLAGALQIQPGSVIITDSVTTFTDQGDGTFLVTSGSGDSDGTIDYFTGAYDVTFSGMDAGTSNVIITFCLFFGRPVMGLRTRELSVINQEQLIGFDTVKANRFSTSQDIFVDISFYKTTGTAFSWTGSNSDFFWTYNYANAFWVTNSVAGFQATIDASAGSGDGIRWYDGTGWINFLPQIDNLMPNSTFLMGARIIVTYRNRLLMLNTTEGTSFASSNNFRQRARWSQNGTPFYNTTRPSGFSGGFDVEAWNEDVVGKGGFIDAPTSEQIVSAEFINDELIVYFERSTWKLAYYGDPILPFVWVRVNVELGAESTFSTIPFDKGLLGVGNYGIVISNGNEIKRIDQKIPDEVFKIHNGNDGVKRVYGIRDFPRQLVYWTFPDEDSNPTFPTRVLVYDYLEGTYAIFNDSLTCFGQYQAVNDITWANFPNSWISQPIPWNSGQLQSDYPLIVAGNQQGFVFKNYNSGPVINDPSLFITGSTLANPAVITSANHNLLEGTFIKISAINGLILAIVTEAQGSALNASTSFSGVLQNPPINPSTVTITIGANIFTDDGDGNLTLVSVNAGTIDYANGVYTVNYTVLGADTAVTADYTKGVNGGVFRVSEPTTNTFEIQYFNQTGNFININSSDLSAYVNNGLIQVRNNISILTKKFNPLINTGYQLRLKQVDYFLEFSSGLEFTTEVFLDENNNQSVEALVVLPATNLLSKVWYPTYYGAIGQFVQIKINFSDAQMVDVNKSSGDITIHALLMYMEKAGRLAYGTIV